MADDLSARLRRLLEAAVPVPWVASFTERGDIYSDADDFSDEQVDMEDHMVVASDGGVLRIADADLICEAVNALPRLLDALDAAPPPERVLPEPVIVADCGRAVLWALENSEPQSGDRLFFMLLADQLGLIDLTEMPDSGADPEPPCPTCGVLEGDGCQAKSGQRCGWDDSPRDDSGDPAIEEPRRVIVDFAEVESDPKPDLMAALKDSIDKAREARRWKCVAPELVSHGVRLAAEWTLHATETDAREAADAYENGHVEHLRDDGEWVRVADPKDGTDA